MSRLQTLRVMSVDLRYVAASRRLETTPANESDIDLDRHGVSQSRRLPHPRVSDHDAVSDKGLMFHHLLLQTRL